MRILGALIEPHTTKQVAESLGEPATKLYHHVAALEKAGLVRLRETRPLRGTVEKYFEAVASRFEVADNVFSGGGGPLRSSAVSALLDQTREGLERALAAGSRVPVPPLIGGAGGRLPRKKLAQFRRRLLALVKEWESAALATGEKGVPASLTLLLFAEPPEKT
jgi:DNA-binding transcriptional ArsR family regulator